MYHIMYNIAPSGVHSKIARIYIAVLYVLVTKREASHAPSRDLNGIPKLKTPSNAYQKCVIRKQNESGIIKCSPRYQMQHLLRLISHSDLVVVSLRAANAGVMRQVGFDEMRKLRVDVEWV